MDSGNRRQYIQGDARCLPSPLAGKVDRPQGETEGAAAGDPIFEMATIYNSYMEFPSMTPEAAAFLGIDVDTAARLWNRTLDLYTQGAGREARADTEKMAQIFGCIRIIDFSDRRGEHPDQKMGIDTCVRDLTKRYREAH